jgi:hypothetical protein
MTEITMLRELRPVPPPAELEAMHAAVRQRFIAGPGSRPARQRWRPPVLAGGLTVAAAALAAVALVLTSGPVAVPSQNGTARHSASVVTTAWTVREDADGTVTIYLRQYTDPAGLQQTLRADGINAIVRPIPSVLRTVGNKTTPSPTCTYLIPDDAAPRAVQQAVWTISGTDLPVSFLIHANAMPQGSALFLAFLAGAMPQTPENGNTGIVALKPVVLTNDTVPACVAVSKPRAPASGNDAP